jgi:hypothetical protein
LSIFLVLCELGELTYGVREELGVVVGESGEIVVGGMDVREGGEEVSRDDMG